MSAARIFGANTPRRTPLILFLRLDFSVITVGILQPLVTRTVREGTALQGQSLCNLTLVRSMHDKSVSLFLDYSYWRRSLPCSLVYTSGYWNERLSIIPANEASMPSSLSLVQPRFHRWFSQGYSETIQSRWSRAGRRLFPDNPPASDRHIHNQ